jgi:hypothetical protein
MNYLVEITGATPEPLRRQLSDESNLLGSSDRCNLCLDHSELEPTALQIDVRADDVWIQNLNPYSIYMGAEEVKSNAWAHWHIGDPVQLTQSISIELEKMIPQVAAGAELVDPDEEDAKSKLNTSKIIQIVLIVVCLAVAPILLFSGGGGKLETNQDEAFLFNETAEHLAANEHKSPEIKTLRERLQSAWVAERRWKRSNKGFVIKRYQQLANHRLLKIDLEKLDSSTTVGRNLSEAMQDNDENGGSLKDKIASIRVLVEARLSELDIK